MQIIMIDFFCKEIAGNKRKHSREKKYMDNKTTQKQQRNKEQSEATTLTKHLSSPYARLELCKFQTNESKSMQILQVAGIDPSHNKS